MTWVNIWGPALLVCFTVIVGILTNNKRVDDLRRDMTGRFGDLRGDMMGRFGDMNGRFNDMRQLVTAESGRLHPSLKLEIDKVEMRVKALEERATLLFRG